MKVAIFVPLAFPFGMVPQEFFLSFFRANEYLLSHLPKNIDYDFQLFSPSTFPIDANRNECVARMINGGFDTSIWLDADQELSEDTLHRLLINGDGHPIYAGMYYLKKPPFHPIVFNDHAKTFLTFNPIWNYPLNELFYADMIGMGCVKIDREVFLQLEKPYFKYGEIPEELAGENPDMAFKRDHGINDVSEDVWFWRQVKQKTGFRIVVDPRVQVGHITKETVRPADAIYKAKLNKRVQAKREGEKFTKWWDENFPQAELVNESANGNVEWLFNE